MRVFVEAARLVSGGQVVEEPVVVIEGPRIVTVEARTRVAPAEARDGVTYRVAGGTILPGLIDTHTHLTCTPGPDDEFTSGISETNEYLLLRAARNAVAALAGGVTTIRDCGSKQFLDVALRDAVRRGVLPGPRMYLCAGLITIADGHMHYWGAIANGADEARRAVRTRVEAGADFIKVMATGGFPRLGSNDPLRVQYAAAALRAIVEEAERAGLRVAAHCLATPGIAAAVEAGIHTIEHALFLGPRGFHYDPEIADAIAARRTPVSNAIVGWHRRLHSSRHRLSAAAVADAERQHAERVRHLRDMVARGVDFVGGSDAGMPLTPFHDLALIIELSVKDLGLSPMEAIDSCTVRAAEALGAADQIGSIRPGALADIVIVTGNPLEQIGAVRNVEHVFVGGRPVWPLHLKEDA